ncbi:MAG: response regulator [bacterium]|nr:response regulator [bacterium]
MKLNILVVEDKPENIAAAKKMLADHNITIVSGFDDALTALKRNGYARKKVEAPEKFDVVLTDCMFPKGGTACMGPQGEAVVNCQGEMPYGPMVVFHAIETGVPNIGLTTQGNHHDDPFVFALDSLKGFKSDKVSVVVTNNCECCIRKTGERAERGDITWDAWDALVKSGEVLIVKDWELLLDRTLGVAPSDEGRIAGFEQYRI